MSELISIEQTEVLSVENIYHAINQLEPRPVLTFTPTNGEEQEHLFLEGSIRNPSHIYDRLQNLSLDEDRLGVAALTAKLGDVLHPDSIEYAAYSQYAARTLRMYDFMLAARDIHSPDEHIADSARTAYMQLNKELYGEPDENTYRSIINDAVQVIRAKELTPSMQAIQAELEALLPQSNASTERFMPSEATMRKMKDIAEYLYGNMLHHVPESSEKIEPEQISRVFEAVIRNELEESAAGWESTVVPAVSINVSTQERLVKVPENRKPVSEDKLRGLVAHEVGVHLLRSVTGEETNVPILRTGLSGYAGPEEGIGMVMEQALSGKYEEASPGFYVAAGLLYFDQKDFRQAHEIMWRLNYLKTSKPGQETSEDTIMATQERAYKTMMRITRGTDELPWFKDLAYFNNTAEMWKYCETACDDPEQFMFLLMGKIDPTNALHRRIFLESRTK